MPTTSSIPRAVLLIPLLLAASLPVDAQSARRRRVAARPVSGAAACAGPGWMVHDDGSAENGIGWDPSSVSYGIYADRFDAGPANGDIIQSVCLQLGRTEALTNWSFSVLLYADGLGGTPGTILGQVDATASGVPPFPGQLYEVDVSQEQVPAAGTFFTAIGYDVVQNDGGFFLATDHSPGSPFTNPLGSSDGGSSWDAVANALPSVRTTMMRVERGPGPEIFTDGFESGDTSSW